MRVWIDQDCCTGAGLCVDHCPELFIVLDDGIGYVRDGMTVMTDPDDPSVAVPRRYEQAAIDAVERCPGECIFLEPDGPPDPAVTRADETDIVREFKRAWEAKDIDALIGVLDPDAKAIVDGGGLVSAVLRPIEGAEQMARFCVDIAGKLPDVTFLERTVNGQPGLVAQQDGVTTTVYAFHIAGDRIKHIWVIRNPDKLRPWTGG